MLIFVRDTIVSISSWKSLISLMNTTILLKFVYELSLTKGYLDDVYFLANFG